MKKRKTGIIWAVFTGIALVALSAVLYWVHYLMFHDYHHIFIYLVGDIAFVPLEVLIVTLIIHRMLSIREKRSMFQKLNMVIGAFFTEMGTELLSDINSFNPGAEELCEKLCIDGKWDEAHFKSAHNLVSSQKLSLTDRMEDLKNLKQKLIGNRDMLLRLLENPNLLEHERFTDTLWAVTHLTEELMNRESLDKLPDSDLEHLEGDIKRAYSRLMHQWLHYLKHLKESYPYLFSLSVRTNPFNRKASPIVT